MTPMLSAATRLFETILRARLDRWHFCQDGVNVYLPPPLRAFAQVALSVNRRKLLGHRAAHQLVHRNSLLGCQALRVCPNRVRKVDSKSAHSCNSLTSSPGLTT